MKNESNDWKNVSQYIYKFYVYDISLEHSLVKIVAPIKAASMVHVTAYLHWAMKNRADSVMVRKPSSKYMQNASLFQVIEKNDITAVVLSEGKCTEYELLYI